MGFSEKMHLDLILGHSLNQIDLESKSNWLVRMTQELNVPVYQREKGVACYLNDSASSHRDGAAFFSILICLIIDVSLLFYFNFSFH